MQHNEVGGSQAGEKNKGRGAKFEKDMRESRDTK